MIKFKKQKDKWNQILRDRKYRPSVFGLSVHFDWRVLLLFFLICLFSILIFGLKLNSKTSELLQKDFSSEVQVKKVDRIEIERFDAVLKKIEK